MWRHFPHAYPEFYNIVRDKDSKVANSLEWTNGGLHWNPLILIFTWELEPMVQFLEDLYVVRINSTYEIR